MASNDRFDELDPLDEPWFYCLEHQTVEPVNGCRNEVRLGPYATRQEAANALEKVEERNQDWEDDPAWNIDDDE